MKSMFLIVVSFLLFANCSRENNKIVKIAGKAQGTTYHVTYRSKDGSIYKRGIDSILKAIDLSLSTYVPSSIISRINRNDSDVTPDRYFREVFDKSVQVSEKTAGVFDVTVAPIINAWGFGFTKKATVTQQLVDSLLRFVGYKMVRLEGDRVVKAKPEVLLDFNAIAQGYSVDVLASYLQNKCITDYLVELGGEVKAEGKKSDKEFWRIGIDQPNEITTEDRPLKAVVSLHNKAMATSGNYRRFYEEEGQKHAHIIDPHTGFPAKHNLLSATVIADDCTTADAYATAFMVMGLERSKQFLLENKNLNLEVYFIYDEQGVWKTYTSETLKKWVEEVH
jgi:thiamine biosynthesis lipoprotein